MSIIENCLFKSHCELIVVDDGSPDGSMKIVERLCASLPNVTILRQVNQGLGVARNSGEGKAVGDYLWFIDSDDWIPSGAIEKVLEFIEATKPEIVNIDYVMSDGRHTTVENSASSIVVYTGLEYLKESLVQNPVQYYIFQTYFYRGCSLRFEKGIYHEDALFTPTALFFAKRVVRLAEDCYVYNVREGSIMTSGNNLKHVRDMLYILRKLDAFKRQHAVGFWQAHVISRYTALAVGGVFHYWKLLSNIEKISVSREMEARLMLGPIFYSGLLKYLLAVAIMLLPPSLRRSVR